MAAARDPGLDRPDGFHKFHSLESAYHVGFVGQILEHDSAAPGSRWIVMEKIHGANFSFVARRHGQGDDAVAVEVASRNRLLSSATDRVQFFRCDALLGAYVERVRRLYSDVEHFCDGTLHSIQLYGELFGGGAYPGVEEEAPADPRVQKGVLYGPRHRFLAFDIRVRLNGIDADVEPGANGGCYLDHDEFERLCSASDIPVVPVLFRGSFADAMAFSGSCRDAHSCVPALFGYPAIASNAREGNVVKPVHPWYTPRRVYAGLKDKNAAFSETARLMMPAGQPATPTTEEAALAPYVCEMRLHNVLSKEGKVTRRDIGRLIGLLARDALAAYWSDLEDAAGAPVTTAERRRMGKVASSLARCLVLLHFATESHN